MSDEDHGEVTRDLQLRFGGQVTVQPTRDEIPTLWVAKEQVRDILRYLKTGKEHPFRMLYDLTAIDERTRTHRVGQPDSDFTVVYHLFSFERNADLRLKVALTGDSPSLNSIVDVFPAANWYEREAWDMFGIQFAGHPNLRRILMPPTWQGHPLRKDHPARATEIGSYLNEQMNEMIKTQALQFHPEEWGLKQAEDLDYLFLNLGPQH